MQSIWYLPSILLYGVLQTNPLAVPQDADLDANGNAAGERAGTEQAVEDQPTTGKNEHDTRSQPRQTTARNKQKPGASAEPSKKKGGGAGKGVADEIKNTVSTKAMGKVSSSR
jgi:hypothetical protein